MNRSRRLWTADGRVVWREYGADPPLASTNEKQCVVPFVSPYHLPTQLFSNSHSQLKLDDFHSSAGTTFQACGCARFPQLQSPTYTIKQPLARPYLRPERGTEEWRAGVHCLAYKDTKGPGPVESDAIVSQKCRPVQKRNTLYSVTHPHISKLPLASDDDKDEVYTTIVRHLSSCSLFFPELLRPLIEFSIKLVHIISQISYGRILSNFLMVDWCLCSRVASLAYLGWRRSSIAGTYILWRFPACMS